MAKIKRTYNIPPHRARHFAETLGTLVSAFSSADGKSLEDIEQLFAQSETVTEMCSGNIALIDTPEFFLARLIRSEQASDMNGIVPVNEFTTNMLLGSQGTVEDWCGFITGMHIAETNESWKESIARVSLPTLSKLHAQYHLAPEGLVLNEIYGGGLR